MKKEQGGHANLAVSGEIALIAVCGVCNCGVDIENKTSEKAWNDVNNLLIRIGKTEERHKGQLDS